MANLTATFNLIDQMSSKMSSIAESGRSMLSKWQDATDETSNAMSSLDSSASSVVKTADGVAVSINSIGTSSGSAANSTEDLSDAIGGYEDAAESAQHAAEELEDSTKDLDDASEDAKDDMEDLGEKGSDAMKTLSDAIAAAGIVEAVKKIGEALLEASEAAEEFETSVAQLQTIAGADSISTLTADISELSNETGISASSLSEVAYNAISAGSAVEDAVGTAEAAAKLATAGFTDTTSALSVLSTAMNSYGDSAGTAEDISNSLIMVQNLGVTTVAELSSQMGKAIATASAYNVSLGNLESSYVSVTKAGIGTAEATTYISGMLNELGSSSSDVSAILSEETGKSFGELMTSGYTLADVLEILYNSCDQDSEAMMNLWGSAEAGKAAAAIVNQGLEEFNTNLNDIENSAGATEEAYETMADTTAYAHQQMTNAMDNLQIAIGSGINPALEKLYKAATTVITAVTDFATKHPTVVKAVTAITVAVGAVTVGVVAFTFATETAIPALVGFGAALDVAMGPVGWVAAGITALTVAIGAFVLMMDDTEDETLEMTSVTKKQYDELQDLQSQYEEACDTYGETSDEASKLRYEIEDLNSAYESGYQTMEEFASEMDAVLQSHSDLMDEFEENESTIKDSVLDNLALIAKLQELASQTDQTASSQSAMQAILDELNGSVEGLNVTYEDLTSNQASTIEMIKQMAEAQAEQEKEQEKYEKYVELLKQQAEEQEALAKATDEVTASTERNNEAQEEFSEYLRQMTQYDTTGFAGIAACFSDEAKQADAASEALSQATDYQEQLQADLDETNEKIAEIEESWEDAKDAADADEAMSDAEAVQEAYSQVQDQIEALAEAYDEAYEAAKESFEGQFGLFDEATTTSEEYMNSSVANAQAALDSQLAYWTAYADNVATLKDISAEDLGISQENYDALMANVQDGSEQAAGLAQSIVDAIQSGDTEAVTELANTLGDVNAKQEEAAATTADWVTDYTSKIDQFSQDMNSAIDDLDLSDEAAANAKSTLDSYTTQLKTSGASAVSAAKSIASQVSAALASANTTVSVSTSSKTGYATGTTDSVSDFIAGEKGPELLLPAHANGTLEGEDAYIAGDNGPELIMGEPGSTVFPHSETDKIIDAIDSSSSYDVNLNPLYVEPTNQETETGSSKKESTDSSTVLEKKISLEINGAGAIDVGGSDKNTILEVLQDHLKPVLMNIIQSEIYEEGDLSYEY